MRSLTLALRGIWWRRWASLALVLVGVACAATAAAAPIFTVLARETVQQTSLEHDPADDHGTGIAISLPLNGSIPEYRLNTLVAKSFAPVRRAGYLRSVVHGQQSQPDLVDAYGARLASTVLVTRERVCAHIVIVSGHCVSAHRPKDVLVTSRTAQTYQLHVGSAVRISDGLTVNTLRVRGIYAPEDPGSPYWFGRSPLFFNQVAKSTTLVPYADALLGTPAVWTKVAVRPGGGVTETVDLTLDLSRLTPGSVSSFRRLISRAIEHVEQPLSGDGSSAIVSTQVTGDVDRAVLATRSVAAPVFVVGVQLAVLTWLVLYLLLAGSAESRTSEIVLGKLRGLTALQTALHAVLEPVLLVLLAVPLGVAVADLAARVAIPTVFGGHATLVLPATAWLAAAGAGVGGVIASVLAATGALRRSVLDQWRGTVRRPTRGGWALELVLLALAAAAALDLASVPTLGTGTEVSTVDQALPGAAPTLLAIAAAVVVARLLPLLARAAIRPTRATRVIALFFAVRQIGRRPADLRVFLLLTLAVALAVFGVAGRTVFTVNRVDRARTDVGTDRVITVAAPRHTDVNAVVDHLDPSGRAAVAVYSGSVDVQATDVGSVVSPLLRSRVLIADPNRFAAVAYWRDDFGSGGGLGEQARPLMRAPPALVRAKLTELRVTGSVTLHSDYPATLYAGLTTTAGAEVELRLARVTPSSAQHPTFSLHADVRAPECARGCALRELSLQPYPLASSPAQASVSLRSVSSSSAGAVTDLLPALRSSSWTSVDQNAVNGPAVTVRTAGQALDVQFSPAYSPRRAEGFATVAGLPRAVPALVTTDEVPRRAHHLDATLGQGLPITLAPTVVRVLPGAGIAGVLLPRSWIPAGSPNGYAYFQPNQVWLDGAAARNFPARLTAAGLTVLSVAKSADRDQQLASSGPSLAISMLLLGALSAGVLAVVGATASLLLASRRRVYELAVVRALGVGRSRVLGSLVLENVLVCSAASFVGVLVGLAGARIALARLPEYSDRPAYPALLLDPPVLLCVLLGIAVVAVIAFASAVGGLSLVRRASAIRLREVQT